MKDHEGDYRGFVWGSQAYYWQALGHDYDEVTFGLFSPEGGTSGEMSVRWETLGGSDVPKLHAFDDAWSALSTFSDVIAEMGERDNENMTPQEFVDLLLSCGFKDDTPRESPYTEKSTDEPFMFGDSDGLIWWRSKDAYSVKYASRYPERFVSWLNAHFEQA